MNQLETLSDNQLFDFVYEICLELMKDPNFSNEELKEFQDTFTILKEPLKNATFQVIKELVPQSLLSSIEKKLIIITYSLTIGFMLLFINSSDFQKIFKDLKFFDNISQQLH